ncbi:MAG: CoA transferase, partial [Acidimicrobiales bacterium]|nr:CoA transferase [Acidimicrobiales bacterium]
NGWICVQDDGEGAGGRLRRAGLASELGDAEVATAGAELERALEGALAALPTDEAVSRLTSAGIPATSARWIAEVAADKEVQAWEIFQSFERPDRSVVQVPGRYARFSRTEQTGVMRPPGIGEHSADVLDDAGLTRDQIEELIAKEAVRQGGPMVYRTLAAYR